MSNIKIESKKDSKAGTGGEIHQCSTIQHEFQDRIYGLYNRVMTIGNKKLTCTVCGKEHKYYTN